MTVNSLSPAFVKINYTSAYGSHVMTVPTVPVISGVYAPTGYAFDLRGAEISVEVSDAVTDYVNILKPFFPASVTFVDALVYVQPDTDSVPTPVASFALGIVGTNEAGFWDKAVQTTVTMRADDFTIFKVVLLDSEAGDGFNKITDWHDGSSLEDLVNYVTADASFLASRGGGKPSTFLQYARTLNEKLRREYGMN